MKSKLGRSAWVNVAAATAISAVSTAFGIDFKEAAARIEKAASPDIKAIETLRCAEAGLSGKEFAELGVAVCSEAAADANPMTRMYAMRALGAMRDKSAIPVLIEALGDDQANVRIEALRAMGLAGDAEILPVLAEAACSVDAGESQAAIWGMASLRGGDIEAELLKLAADTEELAEIRAAAIKAVERRNAVSATPTLLEIARGTEPENEARLAALATLGALGGLDLAPALLELVLSAKTPADSLGAADALASIIKRAGSPEAETDKIIAAIAGAGPDVKPALAGALALVGTPKAAAKVKEIIYEKTGGKGDAEDKLAVIFGRLGRSGTLDALILLGGCVTDMENDVLDDASWPQAEAAYLEAALALLKIRPEEAAAALKKIVGTSQDKKLAKQAETSVDMAWLPAF